ncbi:MAG: Copper binding protein plastocyanin/azurin family [Chloroflexota bacterium]|nr:Copper binding protein plastocyanin/azurin family [Chloroflexota bacterium]
MSTTVPASEAPAGAVRVQLAGPPGHFDPAELTATSGDVVFFLNNVSPGVHSLAIGPALHESLAESANVLNGRAAVFTVNGLQAGHYIIWCTVSNHAAEGMVGTLVVK